MVSVDEHIEQYRIGDLIVDIAGQRVTRNGQEISLPKLSFDLLTALIRHAPNVVTHDRMMAEVWPGLVVSPETLSKRANLLRASLGDDSSDPRYIEVVRGRGYRLAQDVEKLPVPALRKSRYRLAFVGAIVAVLAVGIFVIPKEPPRAKSVAILPFENLSGDPQAQVFTDGVHYDLLTRLIKIADMKIVSRTSLLQYRDTTKTSQQIAAELGVATIMEGGVQRAGDTIRINVQLIDAATDEYLWADSYDRQLTAASIFAIQSEIASAVAEELRATLSLDERQRLATVPTESLPALDAYFRGQQLLEQRSTVALAQAVDHFGEAIDLDANFALAYVGLANSWILQTVYSNFPQEEFYPKAKSMVETALQLDDGLGEAYTTLAVIKEIHEHDLTAADSAYRRALHLSPNYATAHLWYGNFFERSGQSENALIHYQNAVQLDPRAPIMKANVAGSLRDLGHFDQALLQYREILEIDPGFYLAYRAIGDIERFAFGRLHEAVAWYKQGLHRDPENLHLNTWLGLLYLDLGDDATAEYWIQRAQRQGPETFYANVAIGILQTYRGEMDSASLHASKIEDIETTNRYEALLSWQLLSSLSSHDLGEGRHAAVRARYERRFPELLIDTDPKVSLR
ncbi:MAG: winged helix-turn-helix domain-containing protein, partial [Pirellulales bacterium]|nr:winged helix-turn-helix domain-containing protein [Pirellulales bacterium]